VSDVHLHLLRHAHAGDPTKWRRPDAERPLSSRGVRQAEALGRLLRAGGFETDALVSSPKVRAEQTARLVGEALGVPVRLDDRLASGFTREDLAALLHDLGDPADPVLVGHDPDFSELLGELLGVPIELRKGAIARIDVAQPFEPGDGILRWLIPPEVLAPRS
jgi:phosphohistidine phosphatase